MAGRRVVVCNLAEPIVEADVNARAYVLRPSGGESSQRLDVLVRSRAGAWVRKWEPISLFDNFHAKTLGPEHPLRDDERIYDVDADQLALELAAAAARERLRRSRTPSA